MLLPDVLLADEDQVTRSEHAGATAPRASSCVSVRQPAALRPHPSRSLPLPAGPRQLELGGLLRLGAVASSRPRRGLPGASAAMSAACCRYALVSCCRMSQASPAATASASWAACRS